MTKITKLKFSIVYIAMLITAIIMTVISCKKEFSIEGLKKNKKTPIANAGSAISLQLPLDSALLDGTASTDPDGFISEWSWTKISGPASFIFSDAAVSKPVVKKLNAGIYYFELLVKDDDGLSAKDTVQVVVKDAVPPNRPPVANAGADQTIILPTNKVKLNGSGSIDPDNNISNYSWTKISGSSLFHIINTNTVQTEVQNLAEGTYQFELKVTDALGLFAKDTVNILVLPEHQIDNLVFFFPDPSNSVPTTTMSFDPAVILIIVKISNYPDGVIQGVWCGNCSPRCPISSDYFAESDMYTSFNLPAGTYSWSAETRVTNLTSYPVPAAFQAFMTAPHTTQGTITIQPNDNCIIQKIVF